ncbi:MAG TPA: MerR family transcriptional regulator [Streptosporangiaceae bacterium]|nr:MerR family transcriptional regulator [Streptosporangiaceae bacterium]
MYGIGTVARLAQVSVRTLRHYDDIGLLTPARVDPLTGYRHYTPGQVLRLHRILVLRDLGVPLSQIGQLIDDDVTVDELRGILRLRQAEARARLAAQTEQLTRVEIRLAQLEEGSMADYDVIVKRLEPLRVVALSESLSGVEEISAACGRMYPRLHAALAQHRVGFDGLSLALYEDTGDEDVPLRLTTALQIPAGVTIQGDGLTTMDLPTVERAATTVVRGAPDRFPDAYRALHEWIDRAGEQATSFERELYIDCDGPRDTWVTELQALPPDRKSAQGGTGG